VRPMEGSLHERMSSTVQIEGAPTESRKSLRLIVDQSFQGIYRWHARRTLRSVKWVRKATRAGTRVGLTMVTMLGQSCGYICYIAVTPAQRAKGIGGFLLDDALELLRAAGAQEVFACAQADNVPSIRLLRSRDFVRTGFRELVLVKGFARTARLWIRMVVAPGERVFVRAR
jgi:ribosomal protein S18 acetylase RimI-like enzyme